MPPQRRCCSSAASSAAQDARAVAFTCWPVDYACPWTTVAFVAPAGTIQMDGCPSTAPAFVLPVHVQSAPRLELLVRCHSKNGQRYVHSRQVLSCKLILPRNHRHHRGLGVLTRACPRYQFDFIATTNEAACPAGQAHPIYLWRRRYRISMPMHGDREPPSVHLLVRPCFMSFSS